MSIVEKCGVKYAILIGELMKSIASNLFIREIRTNKTLINRLAALQVFEKTYNIICEGQFQDLEFESDFKVTETKYISLIEKTTALFIQSSIVIGALLAGLSKRIICILEKYGLYLGLAFQIRDDIIDLIGEEDLTGKKIGGDIKRKKMRLPIVHALSQINKKNSKRIKKIYEKTFIEITDINEILNILHDSNSINYCINRVKFYANTSIKLLERLESNEVTLRLEELSNLIANFDD